MQIELRDGSTDFAKLQSVTSAIVGNAQSQSALQHVSTTFRATAPQIRIDVDRAKAQTVHVSVDQVFSTLATYFGSDLRRSSSTNSAACSRSMCRPMRRSGCVRATSIIFGCATRKAT